MMFARAIGDTNPVYHDAAAAKDTEADGVIAPPSFPQAVAQFDPEYHLRPKPDQKWFGSAKGPSPGSRASPPPLVVCTPNSITNTTRHVKPRRCADRRDQTGQGTWEKRKQTCRQTDIPRTRHRIP